MIYVPDKENYKCYIVQSEGVLRGYEEIPRYNATIQYRDFYIRSNYIYKDGEQSFGAYATIPTCLDNNDLTTEAYYRNDFSQILIIFAIMCIFCLYLPWRIFVRLFRRFK